MSFATIKRFYDNGLWSIYLVRMAVKKGIIKKEQYKAITGEEY